MQSDDLPPPDDAKPPQQRSAVRGVLAIAFLIIFVGIITVMMLRAPRDAGPPLPPPMGAPR